MPDPVSGRAVVEADVLTAVLKAIEWASIGFDDDEAWACVGRLLTGDERNVAIHAMRLTKGSAKRAVERTLAPLLAALTTREATARADARREERPYTKVGVTALIVDAGRVLLGLKGRAFSAEFTGKWVTPGGRVDYGESLEAAVIREVREETGLVVSVGRPMQPREIIHDKGHFVFFAYECTPLRGALAAGDDLTEVAWCSPDQLREMSGDMTDLTRAVVDEYMTAILTDAPADQPTTKGDQ